MKTDTEGLVYSEDGSLAYDNGKLERANLENAFRELGPGEVGFTKAEAEYFGAIVQEQIRHFERKKHGGKGRKKGKKLLKEIENTGCEGVRNAREDVSGGSDSR